MKQSNNLKALLICLSVISGSCSRQDEAGEVIQAADFPVPEISLQSNEKENSLTYEQYVLQLMDICGQKLSEVQKKIRAQQIAQIVPAILPEREDQEQFVAHICIESGFVSGLVSTAGATGVAQVMPKYAQEFANHCELGKLGESDVTDTAVNITLGACYFKFLRTLTPYSTIAAAAYNAGPNSDAVKKLQKLGAANPETANYVAKIAFLKERMEHVNANVK